MIAVAIDRPLKVQEKFFMLKTPSTLDADPRGFLAETDQKAPFLGTSFGGTKGSMQASEEGEAIDSPIQR